MKKDIPILKVENVAVAIIPEKKEKPEFWDVYLVNLKNTPLKNVLVNSTGYGEVKGNAVKTTTLRYFFEEIHPNSFEKIEVLQDKLTELANEYWISFSLDGHMYDKRYVFVKGSLTQENFTNVPLIELKGVMIK